MRGRAFVPPGSLQVGRTMTLSAEESHYLVRVRRARVGDAVELLDGVDARHAATLRRADARAAEVEVGDAIVGPVPPPVVVLVATVEARAITETLTVASEVGAETLVFVRTARAQPATLAAERIARVVAAAQRQCGRARPLQVIPGELSLDDALAHRPELPGRVAVPGASTDPPADSRGARVLIGPEGGLTADELERARAAGFAPLGLGPYVQRTPTAVTSAVALLLAR